MELRDYQRELTDKVFENDRRGIKRQILFAPTGAGKTVTACALIDAIVQRGGNALFVVNKEPLIAQTVRTIERFGYRPKVIKAGQEADQDSPVTVGMLQTMLARNEWPQADIVILDEAHGSISPSYDEIWARYDCLIVGATATPFRTSKRESLSLRYSAIVGNLQTEDLQATGALVSCRTVAAVDVIDLDGLEIAATGDYKAKDLQLRCDTPEVTQAAIDLWREQTPGERTIVFCSGVEHSEHVAAAFNAIGVRSEQIDGDTLPEARQEMYGRLDSGETLVLTSCDVLSIGFDLPSVTVGLSLRPTASKGLYIQQVGRILRPSPGKLGAVWLDVAGNCWRHGLISERIALTLDTPQEKSKGPAPLKRCGECGEVIHAAARECPNCGHVFPIHKKRLKPIGFRSIDADDRFSVLLADLQATQGNRGYKPSWIRFELLKHIPANSLSLGQWDALGDACGYARGWGKHQIIGQTIGERA